MNGPSAVAAGETRGIARAETVDIDQSFTIAGGRLVANRDLYWGLEDEFEAHCRRLVETEARELVLDLSRIRFVFSSYMGRIVKLYGSALEHEKSLKVIISPELERLFTLAGFTEAMSVEVRPN